MDQEVRGIQYATLTRYLRPQGGAATASMWTQIPRVVRLKRVAGGISVVGVDGALSISYKIFET